MVLKVGIASHCLENYKDCKVYIKLVLLSSLNMSFENILVKYMLWKNTAILQKSRKDLKNKQRQLRGFSDHSTSDNC